MATSIDTSTWSDRILDIYHDDLTPLSVAQDQGIVAVIHKASEGATWQDPAYANRRHEARGLGMLWGAYHFSSGKPAKDQAKNFLDAIQWGADPTFDSQTLLCLDFENSHSGANMTFKQACDFVQAVHDATEGVWPMVYGSNLVRDADTPANAGSVLANCPLWYANYNSTPQQVPSNVWTKMTLWQYTDSFKIGKEKLDRNKFNGTDAQLPKKWPFH
jgi:GH25 family lysozyme M1 (1,4-beta-N-acetylmuramidase)